MKHYFFLFMIIAGLTSCQNDPYSEERSTENRYPEHIISFSPNTENEEELSSRGTPITNVQQMTDMGVFCAYTGSSDWTTTATPGKMFNTALVRNQLTNRWEYRGAPISWDAVTGNDRYSFFAYAPYATAQNGITVQGNSSTTGIPSITYTTPSDVTVQPDLMLAVPRYNLRPSNSMVALEMKHALACVGFQVMGNGEKIKSISISGIYTSGTSKITGDVITWSNLIPPTVPTDYSAMINFDAGKDYFTAQPTMSTNLVSGNGYLMMIPQTLSTDAKLKLTFSDNSVREISLNSQVWNAGKKITYNIIITTTGIITLSPSSMSIPSIGVTSSTDNFELTCTPSDTQWTLTSTATWLRITTTASGSDASSTISGQGAATIYTVADANTQSSSRIAYLYVNNDKNKVVGTVTQLRKTDLTGIKNGGTRPLLTTSYVGAFWRANQTGERIIRIPVGANEYNTGAWSASVEWMDNRWQPGDIIFSSTTSLDPGISYTQDLTPGDAETYKVTEKLTLASGNALINGAIYFRIGLNSTYIPTEANPARYAVVTLTYNNNAKTQLILLRQGEDADYIMRPEDPATGSYNNPTRPLARKVAAFNITQPSLTSWPGGSQISYHPVVSLRGGIFTEYPSQAGAYFQWSPTIQILRAYHPANPVTGISGWDASTSQKFWREGTAGSTLADKQEVCPIGYRRINDGSETDVTNTFASSSELRQSLLLLLFNGTDYNIPTNATSGYYADGFFDRRQIKNSPSDVTMSTVSYYSGTNNPLNAKIAYSGTLIYNPTTWASVFLPSMGLRSPTDGTISQTGQRGCYWTSSSKDTKSFATCISQDNVGYMILGTEYNRPTGGGIRCVKIP